MGGGFAGLSAAIAFRQNGHDVTVYERTATPSAEGGAISLAGNALACLAVLGIADRVVTQPYSRMPASVRTRDGRVLIRRSLAQLAGSDEIAVVPRAQLISWLTAALPSACLQYACDVNRVGVDGTVDVDGITHQFDLVVAADGGGAWRVGCCGLGRQRLGPPE